MRFFPVPLLTSQEPIGSVVGSRYELREPIGEGASAIFFASHDRLLGREVGVKVMRQSAALSSVQERERFRREAQTLARLRHPHLVEVFDTGETEDGAPYLVVELLRGETLATRLQRGGRLHADEALAIALPLMGALACAHDVGVIHRDVKPANIFLARRGGAVVPKLLDFGIAKLPDEPGMTAAGTTLGTPAFMAPEQARGERLTPAADVWALGVTLFECLSGSLPFRAPTAAGLLLEASKHGVPRLQVDGLDRGLALTIEQALSLDPRRRPATMRAMARSFVHSARRARVALPPEPDPVGLADFHAWCREAADERATDELAIVPSEPVLAPEPHPAEPPIPSGATAVPSGATAGSQSALAVVRVRRVSRAMGLGLTVALGIGAALTFHWLSASPSVPTASLSVERPQPTQVAPGVHTTVAQPPPAVSPPIAQPLLPDAPQEVAAKPTNRPEKGRKKRAVGEPSVPTSAAVMPPPRAPVQDWDF